jgi:hypothetical protein
LIELLILEANKCFYNTKSNNVLISRKIDDNFNCFIEIPSEINCGILIAGHIDHFSSHLPNRIRSHHAGAQYCRSQRVHATIRQRYSPLTDIDIRIVGKDRDQSMRHTFQYSTRLCISTGRNNYPIAPHSKGQEIFRPHLQESMDVDIRALVQFFPISTDKIQLKMLADVEMKVGIRKDLQQEIESLEYIAAPAEEKKMSPSFLEIFPVPSLPIDRENRIVDPDYVWKLRIGLYRPEVPQTNNAIGISQRIILGMLDSPISGKGHPSAGYQICGTPLHTGVQLAPIYPRREIDPYSTCREALGDRLEIDPPVSDEQVIMPVRKPGPVVVVHDVDRIPQFVQNPWDLLRDSPVAEFDAIPKRGGRKQREDQV